ncbi:MAG: hypothetical protein R6T83_11735 [Salinibacter sp.]
MAFDDMKVPVQIIDNTFDHRASHPQDNGRTYTPISEDVDHPMDRMVDGRPGPVEGLIVTPMPPGSPLEDGHPSIEGFVAAEGVRSCATRTGALPTGDSPPHRSPTSLSMALASLMSPVPITGSLVRVRH